MKKFVICLFICISLLCAACGKDEKNAGTWDLKGTECEGLLVEPEVLGIEASLSLESNGSGRLSVGEYGYAVTSWSVKDGAVLIKTSEEALEGRLTDGYIVLYFEDGIGLYFAKAGTKISPLPLLGREAFEAAYAALVESGSAMPAD